MPDPSDIRDVQGEGVPQVPPGLVPTRIEVAEDLDALTIEGEGGLPQRIPLIPMAFQTPLGTHTYRLTADSAEFIARQLLDRAEKARAEQLKAPSRIVVPVPPERIRMNGHGGS
jgi:hypothetical protein